MNALVKAAARDKTFIRSKSSQCKGKPKWRNEMFQNEEER